jgi:hypothetical protein
VRDFAGKTVFVALSVMGRNVTRKYLQIGTLPLKIKHLQGLGKDCRLSGCWDKIAGDCCSQAPPCEFHKLELVRNKHELVKTKPHEISQARFCA